VLNDEWRQVADDNKQEGRLIGSKKGQNLSFNRREMCEQKHKHLSSQKLKNLTHKGDGKYLYDAEIRREQNRALVGLADDV